jgi:SnoaL-like polyketide cyclase
LIAGQRSKTLRQTGCKGTGTLLGDWRDLVVSDILGYKKVHWQLADGARVITYKTYYGTHEGLLLGVAPTHRRIHFETVDVMRVQNGKITDHWGVGNLLSLMQQIGGWIPPAEHK